MDMEGTPTTTRPEEVTMNTPATIPVAALRVGDIIVEDEKRLNMGTMEYFHQTRNHEVSALEAIPPGPSPDNGTDYGDGGTKVTFTRRGPRWYHGHMTVQVNR